MNATGVNEKKAEWIKQNCAKALLLKMPKYNDYDLIMVLKKCSE